MKKALAIISAVALVTGVAFAADAPALKLSGQIETGIGYQKSGSDDAMVAMYNDDAGMASRLDIAGDFVNGDSGVSFKLRDDSGLVNAPTVYNAYAWSNLFGGLVTVKAGNLNDTDGASQWKSDGDIGITVIGRNGVQVQVKPVAGLNFGVMVNLPSVANTVAGYTTKQLSNELGFAGGYSSDLFVAHAGYLLDSDADDTGLYADKNSMFYADVNYKGVKNLTAKAEAKFEGLGKYSEIGKGTYDQVIGYQISDPLYAGVLLYEKTYGNSDLKTGFLVRPNGNYKLNSIVTINGEFQYETNIAGVKDINNMYVKAGPAFQLSPNAKINSFFKTFTADTGDKSATGKTTTNSVQVDFIYSF